MPLRYRAIRVRARVRVRVRVKVIHKAYRLGTLMARYPFGHLCTQMARYPNGTVPNCPSPDFKHLRIDLLWVHEYI